MKKTRITKELLTTLLVYLAAWPISFLLIFFLALSNGRSISNAASLFFELLSGTDFIIAIHVLFLALYVVFLILRYFIRIFKKNGARTLVKRLAFRLLLPIGLLVVTFKTLVYANSMESLNYKWQESHMNQRGEPNNFYVSDGLHRGMSVFGWDRKDNTESIRALIHANIEWVAVIPFIYQKDETTNVIPAPESGKWSRRDSLFIKAINELHDNGLKVHLKPHLWTGNGWRSNLRPADWDAWFTSYKTRILRYAKMAEMTGAELFCVGTELKTSIKNQPEAWRKLIAEVRQIYSGRLTYAANWHDEYEFIDFWNELDYIGIQAYFPLTKAKNPKVGTIEKGWRPHIKAMEQLYTKYKTPILFTEVGYKSEASATIRPWEWGSYFSVLFRKKSDRTQLFAYDALFKQVWHQKWFHGMYFWQWDNRSSAENAEKNLDFSPRFKPAENLMAKWYGMEKNTTRDEYH